MDAKDAYICYNSADLVWVRGLAEQLESETIDGTRSGRFLQVFFDRWDMDIGDSLIDRMNEGIAKSRHVITVLSPEFTQADWPKFEWKHIVADDPTNSGGKLIPLLLRDLSLDGTRRIELPAPFRDLKYLDFRQHSNFAKNFAELVRRIRGLANPRGKRRPSIAPSSSSLLPISNGTSAAWSPDAIPELLISNLLSVTRLPTRIWGVPTRLREKTEVWDRSPEAPPFVIRGGHIFTFADLERDTKLFDGSASDLSAVPVSVNDWALDKDKSRWLTALLNSCLSSSLWHRRIKCDEKGRFFFKPDRSKERKVKTLGFRRTVAKWIEGEVEGTGFWVHHSAQIGFKSFGDRLFLQLEPAYLFTEDGSIAIGGKSAGKLSQMWTGKQQNQNILRDVLFWADVLAGRSKKIRLKTGGVPIEIEPIPSTAKCNRGIRFDEIGIKSIVKPRADELERVADQIDDLEDYEDDEEDDYEA